MSEDLVERWIVSREKRETFTVRARAVGVRGRFTTEGVSAGQHSYDVVEFVTASGATYPTYAVYDTMELAEAEAERVVSMSRKRLMDILEEFE